MKAFLAGFLFIIAVSILAGLGVLLFPLLLVLTFFLRIIISFAIVLLAIWLLGKFIIFVWERLRG
jgi:hypothetical protein